MVSGEDQELGHDQAEPGASICHHHSNREAVGGDSDLESGECPGWTDTFGSHQHLDEDNNCVFGTFVSPLPVTQHQAGLREASESVQGTPE